MPSRPCRFTEVEVARAIRSVERAGRPVSSVEIDVDGRIIVHCAPTGKTNAARSGNNEWDEVLE